MGRVRRRQFRGRRGRLRRQSRRWQHGRLRREQLGLLRGGQRCRQLGRHRLRQPRGLLGRLGCRDAAVSWADFGFDSWAGFGADRVAWPGILGLCSARALLWVADLNGSLLPVMRACGARSPLHEWQRRPTERSGRHGLTNVRAALLRSSSAYLMCASSHRHALHPRRRGRSLAAALLRSRGDAPSFGPVRRQLLRRQPRVPHRLRHYSEVGRRLLGRRGVAILPLAVQLPLWA